jgi:hypothetical protein
VNAHATHNCSGPITFFTGVPKRDTVVAALPAVAIGPADHHNRHRGYPGAYLEDKRIDQLDGGPAGFGRREASAGGLKNARFRA